uniref:Uncharacterized protein n=1 Tax=viral metagenome TaxID=1070528 RepID=A0A6M3J6G2_9ZZZZ
MAYPSVLSTFTDPLATQKLSSPSHSSIETAQNDGIKQLEKVIGTDASTLGTIIGDLRSASSDGGGHVQTAVLGGTGQTTFTKGDVLIAQSASVLGKLAVGTDNQVILADSTAPSGIKWADDSTPRIHSSMLSSICAAGAAETSVFSVTIPGSVLGDNNAVRARLNGHFVYDGANTTSTMARMTFGGGRVASVLLAGGDFVDGSGYIGTVECNLFANGHSSIQAGEMLVQFMGQQGNFITSVTGITRIGDGVASVKTGGNQTLGLTWQFSDAQGGNVFYPRGLIVEKIT